MATPLFRTSSKWRKLRSEGGVENMGYSLPARLRAVANLGKGSGSKRFTCTLPCRTLAAAERCLLVCLTACVTKTAAAAQAQAQALSCEPFDESSAPDNCKRDQDL